jgi:hypothetical protein
VIHEKQFDPFPKYLGKRSALQFSAASADVKSTRNTWFMIPLEETFPSGFLH